jgi:hypothetical protein
MESLHEVGAAVVSPMAASLVVCGRTIAGWEMDADRAWDFYEVPMQFRSAEFLTVVQMDLGEAPPGVQVLDTEKQVVWRSMPVAPFHPGAPARNGNGHHEEEGVGE